MQDKTCHEAGSSWGITVSFSFEKYFDFSLAYLKLYYITENKKIVYFLKYSGQNNAVFIYHFLLKNTSLSCSTSIVIATNYFYKCCNEGDYGVNFA